MRLLALENVGVDAPAGVFAKRRQVLDDVTLRLDAGDDCAFFGANGVGKTTTLLVALGLIRPHRGAAYLFGHPAEQPRARRAVGFAPEQPALPKALTATEWAIMGARLAGVDSHRAARAAKDALERVALGAKADAALHTLSKGQRQRASLAHAIVAKPELLVLDEPFSGLDAPSRLRLQQLLAEERRRGATLFFSTHAFADALALCPKAALLLHGRIAFFGPPTALLTDESGFGAPTIDVMATALTPAAHAAAATLARQVRQAGDTTTWTVRGLDQANTLIDALRANGATVVRLDAEARALEGLLQAAAAIQATTC